MPQLCLAKEPCQSQELGGGFLVGSLSGVLGSNPGEAASSAPARSGVLSGVAPSSPKPGLVGVSSRLPCCCAFVPSCEIWRRC